MDPEKTVQVSTWGQLRRLPGIALHFGNACKVQESAISADETRRDVKDRTAIIGRLDRVLGRLTLLAPKRLKSHDDDTENAMAEAFEDIALSCILRSMANVQNEDARSDDLVAKQIGRDVRQLPPAAEDGRASFRMFSQARAG